MSINSHIIPFTTPVIFVWPHPICWGWYGSQDPKCWQVCWPYFLNILSMVVKFWLIESSQSRTYLPVWNQDWLCQYTKRREKTLYFQLQRHYHLKIIGAYPLKVTEELGTPNCLQTAFRKGFSCSDAIFTTQEALLTHIREGGYPYLCLFDLEKAFDCIEYCVLL